MNIEKIYLEVKKKLKEKIETGYLSEKNKYLMALWDIVLFEKQFKELISTLSSVLKYTNITISETAFNEDEYYEENSFCFDLADDKSRLIYSEENLIKLLTINIHVFSNFNLDTDSSMEFFYLKYHDEIDLKVRNKQNKEILFENKEFKFHSFVVSKNLLNLESDYATIKLKDREIEELTEYSEFVDLKIDIDSYLTNRKYLKTENKSIKVPFFPPIDARLFEQKYKSYFLNTISQDKTGNLNINVNPNTVLHELAGEIARNKQIINRYVKNDKEKLRNFKTLKEVNFLIKENDNLFNKWVNVFKNLNIHMTMDDAAIALSRLIACILLGNVKYSTVSDNMWDILNKEVISFCSKNNDEMNDFIEKSKDNNEYSEGVTYLKKIIANNFSNLTETNSVEELPTFTIKIKKERVDAKLKEFLSVNDVDWFDTILNRYSDDIFIINQKNYFIVNTKYQVSSEDLEDLIVDLIEKNPLVNDNPIREMGEKLNKQAREFILMKRLNKEEQNNKSVLLKSKPKI